MVVVVVGCSVVVFDVCSSSATVEGEVGAVVLIEIGVLLVGRSVVLVVDVVVEVLCGSSVVLVEVI